VREGVCDMNGDDFSREDLVECFEDTERAVEKFERLTKNNPRIPSFRVTHKSLLKRRDLIQSECIRLGYGEYVDGVFVLKNGDTHTD